MSDMKKQIESVENTIETLKELLSIIKEVEDKNKNESKPVKWNPIGGEWCVYADDATNISCESSINFGLRRPTKEQAERAAVEMRRFNRLLALRDELCGDLNAHNYEIIFDIVNEKWCISKVNCYKTVSAGFTTYDTAQRACDMLNSGEVEL